MAAVPWPLRRPVFLYCIAGAISCIFLTLVYRESIPNATDRIRPLFYQAKVLSPQQPLEVERVPCYGPRGKLLPDSPDDQVQSVSLDLPFPDPVGGSYETLGLPQTWNTPGTRYGAYGYGEDQSDYNRSRVAWEEVNWAKLQNDCLQRNRHRFQHFTKIAKSRKFDLRDDSWFGIEPLHARSVSRGRTAIVLRGWDTYHYTPADLYHIRSLIMEAGLSSGGEYVVFLLVDVKDGERRIFHDAGSYQKALEDFVPQELRNIAVLFDRELLQSWYPDVNEHSAFYQIYQPMQLFARKFDSFDHYWQLELDSKITGHSGIFLDALSRFGRNEPRKQSVERSSYFYMPQVHGSYSEFSAAINESLNGGGLWGPVKIPDIPNPIGPPPPKPFSEDDDFIWGVGEDADLLLTNALASISAAKFWPFKDWIKGFKNGPETPRFYSPVAMTRCSWNLLNAMHYAQMTDGLQLPGEATPVSFALYHGLKVVFPPHPWFHKPQRDVNISGEELEHLFNGGSPAENAKTNDGFSFGSAMYDPDGNYELFNGGTWWWVPGYPGRVMRRWMKQEGGEGTPTMLREHEGEVYAPMMALHPVKSGDNG